MTRRELLFPDSWNTAHHDVPNITVPAGFARDHLPLDVSFFGSQFSEPTLFVIGYEFEQTTRAGNRQVLLNLHRTRRSLQRLRHRPEVALLILSSGNIALTAHGSASVVAEAENDANYATVLIEVDQIHDHRQPAFRVESGVAVVSSG